MAIDRNAIAQGVFQGVAAARPPRSSPRSFPAAYQDGVCDACRFDPAQAKRARRAGGPDPRHRA